MTDEVTKEKENAIITAASRRFAHYGFSKVTMEEIAADVEMGKASLYYYFPTKESLFQAVLWKEQEAFIAEMEVVINSPLSASEKLLSCVNKRLIYFQKFINLGTLSLHSFIDNNTVYRKFFLSFEEKELELINRILSEGQANGEFRNDLEPGLDKALIHILHGLRIRTLKIINDASQESETFNALQKEMTLVTKIFIRGISK